ncbi:lipopolysaccharide biosynthesis protein [Flexivirga alba]|uniref:Lipopolysaccharide biosynthesis protein n=1 Tax=Flexivirga alba TaxID=702742 RepID=A0ABW2AGH4_9MICO
MSGVAGGQLVALLASPILGRLFPPAQYGPFAVINAAIMPLGTVAGLRLELAIPLPLREGMARDVARLALRICAIFGVAGLVITWYARDAIASALGQGTTVASLVPWVPVVAAEVGAFAVLNQLAIRQKEYGAIARRSLLQAAATVAAQIAAGIGGLGAQGLALGLAVGQGVGVVTLAVSVRTKRKGKSTVYASGQQILQRFRTFPLLLAPAGLLNSLGLQAPVLLASALFGVEVSGWLGMTQRILALPIALVGTTLAQVYLGEFGEAKRTSSNQLSTLFVRTSKRLAVVGVIIAVVVMLFGPLAFSVVLGHRWETSGMYAQALAVGLVVQMVASPLSQTLIVMGKNLQQLVWDIGRLAASCGAVYLGYRLGFTATVTMWLLGAAMAMCYACLWLMSWHAVGHNTSGHHLAGGSHPVSKRVHR